MFHKSLQQPNTTGNTQNKPSPRVTHTPGAYPALQPRNSQNIASETTVSQTPLETATNESKPIPAIKEEGNRLLVGPDVKLKGAEIQDCDTLIVEGRVEATMDSRVIRIAQHGAYNGKVGIDIAEIHGNFEGELTARQQLIIHATGRVKGTIRYGSLLIESGGQICGDIQAMEQSGPASLHVSGKEVDRTKVTSLISSVA